MLSQARDWTFEDLEQYTQAIDQIATEELKLSVYPNQIEIITAEQMLDAYSSSGLPVMYKHWSFGKDFIRDYDAYKAGRRNLAYEIVINSNPCIAYCMEENTLPMQALVIAHACYGHNGVFKNNYLFKERTHASTIIDYLCHVRDTIRSYEEQHGADKVELFLDSVHSLQQYACDHYVRARELSQRELKEQREQRQEGDRLARNELWDGLERIGKPGVQKGADPKAKDVFPNQPTENILGFIGKYSPNLEDWQRDIIEFVCTIRNYFWPQMQTQILNEGFATFVHRYIIQRLYEKGLIGESFMHEILLTHTNVIWQPNYNNRNYSGLNPYAIGYAIFEDIRRICTNPTDEDKKHFPNLIGKDWVEMIKYAAFNFRDDSFIENFLSPKVMRDFKLFASVDVVNLPFVEITATHSDSSFDELRQSLANQRNIHRLFPHVEVTSVDTKGNRTLKLTHTVTNQVLLDETSVMETLKHVHNLWQFDVQLDSIEKDPFGDTEVLDSWLLTKDKSGKFKFSRLV